LLSLLVLPALYLRFGGRQPVLSPEEELMHRWAGVEPAAVPASTEPVTAAPAVPGAGDGAAAEGDRAAAERQRMVNSPQEQDGAPSVAAEDRESESGESQPSA
jgi:hypothetical protein